MGNTLNSFKSHQTNDLNTLDNSINNFCVTIFSKKRCIYCKKVKEVFDKNGINYHIVDLDQPNYENLQTLLVHKTGSKTVPQIFVNGLYVGGAKETQHLINNGTMASLLLDCPHNKEINNQLTCFYKPPSYLLLFVFCWLLFKI